MAAVCRKLEHILEDISEDPDILKDTLMMQAVKEILSNCTKIVLEDTSTFPYTLEKTKRMLEITNSCLKIMRFAEQKEREVRTC